MGFQWFSGIHWELVLGVGLPMHHLTRWTENSSLLKEGQDPAPH